MKPPPTELPEHEARRLLQLATGLDAAGVGLLDSLTPEQEARFAAYADRRLAGEPLQYIEGTVQFGPVEVKVDRRVLIPRPETELLWERAVEAAQGLPDGAVIVDMCTGSGALALALKHAFPTAWVYATDIDSAAAELAEDNLAGSGVSVLVGDLFDALPFNMLGRIDLLVANPPYVADGDDLPSEVHDHEPHRALYAGPRGDEILTAIAARAFYWVRPGGWVFLEIGETPRERVLELFADFRCEIHEDLAGRPRILAAYRGETSCIEGAR
jgi:release factor glutamine methyltransferase